MGSAFHQLCPRYSDTLTPNAPTAIRLCETITFFKPPCEMTDVSHLKIKTEIQNDS